MTIWEDRNTDYTPAAVGLFHAVLMGIIAYVVVMIAFGGGRLLGRVMGAILAGLS